MRPAHRPVPGAGAAALAITALLGVLAVPPTGVAQPVPVHRVGVVHQGGGDYESAMDGLREGLRELGLEEGKQIVLHVRDVKGDLKAVEAAAKSLEAEKVELIVPFSTSTTLAVKRATQRVPIVFYAGTDPVSVGLVESIRKPGGRLTGIHGRTTDLTAKRLELLRELVPSLRRVVVFYNPDNRAARESLAIARSTARQLKVELLERPVASVEALRAGLRALRPGEVDAYLHVSDAMMTSQADLIIETARAKKLATMFNGSEPVARGALAGYGLSYRVIGRLAARYVQRVLQGALPGDLPVEQLDRPQFTVNLKTAKGLGLAIPESVRLRADELIE